jgi:hypothetical protein
MKRKRSILVIVVLLAGACSWFCTTGYQCGRADFEAIARRDAPTYAKHYAYLLDGGSEWFRGRGYSVYRMHRILMGYGNNPPEGYLGGAKILWSFPIRLFAWDDDSYFYIPDDQESANKTVQRTEASRFAQETNRTSSAAGSRRSP